MRGLLLLLDRISTGARFVITLALVLLVGVLDYATGPEISFSIFYLLPVAIAAWSSGRALAYFIAAIAALDWYAAEQLAGLDYSHPAIGYWNAVAAFLVSAIVLHFVGGLRGLLQEESRRADLDPLTRLLNKHAFAREAERELARARRLQAPVAVAFMDLDNFKQVNDTAGHAAGDAVLNAVARTLREGLRGSDLVGRLGGDEFAMLLPETEPPAATAVVAGLRERLLRAMTHLGTPQVTFSIGLALLPRPVVPLQVLLATADRLMYEAKRAGKNRVHEERITGP